MRPTADGNLSAFRFHATTDRHAERSTDKIPWYEKDAFSIQQQQQQQQHLTDGRLEPLRYRSGSVAAEQDKQTRMRLQISALAEMDDHRYG